MSTSPPLLWSKVDLPLPYWGYVLACPVQEGTVAVDDDDNDDDDDDDDDD